MHLNKYASHIKCICATTLLLWYTYRPHFTAHKSHPKQSATGIPHIIAQYVPETNMPYQHHIGQLLHVQISNNYVSVYTSYELTASNIVTSSITIPTFHIIGIFLNKYSWHITCLCHCTTGGSHLSCRVVKLDSCLA